MTRDMSRRKFVRMTAGAAAAVGASLALPGCTRPVPAVAPKAVVYTSSGAPYLQSGRLRKFVNSLPGLGPDAANEIGQYLPMATKTTQKFAGLQTDVYNLGVGEYSQLIDRDLPGPTHFLGYYDIGTADKKYLGGVIVAKRGTPILLNVTNKLPNKALIPTDPTLMAGPDGMMVGGLPLNRHTTHMHGGLTPWFSDGTPLQWFDPTGKTGESFMNVPGTTPAAGTASFYYPMNQSARLLWYHDHAMGITRTNAYSGIASGLVLVDDFEIGLVNRGLLPDLVGTPLIIQDKSFVTDNIKTTDPTWAWGNPGDLWYPHEYVPNVLKGGKENPKGLYGWGPTSEPVAKRTQPLPPVSAVPEAFLNTILVNGGVYPVVKVQPRRVRFRMLNGSQARFYHLTLLGEDASNPGEANLKAPGPVMYQVATEGGFLPAVAIHDNKTKLPMEDSETAKAGGPFNLLLAPAERADVVIDFNGVPEGQTFILYSDAPAPFPGGDPRNDYYTGDKNQLSTGGSAPTEAGWGPNTRTLLKIQVVKGSADKVATDQWLQQLNGQLKANFLSGNQPGLLYNGGDPITPGPFPFKGTVTRKLSLNEDFDEYGRLIQTIGTMTSQSKDNQGISTWGLPYLDAATETPAAGATEVWQIFNLTGDVHPIHFHLVNVQLIQRQKFDGHPNDYKLVGSPKKPAPNEMGWKETVRMNPEEVTTVIMKFDLPVLPTAAMTTAVSPRTGGAEYVWHCHILEHEEHDMMRPLIVK